MTGKTASADPVGDLLLLRRRHKAELHAAHLELIALEATYAKELADRAESYGVNTTGLSVPQLKREVSRGHIKLSASSMKMGAENSLLFVPADSQGADYARDVIAGHTKFLQAFEAGDAEAALRHFVDMHDAAGRLSGFQILPYIKDGLKKWGKLKGKDKISKLSRGRPLREQKARDRYREEWAKVPAHYELSDGKIDSAIRTRLCTELRHPRPTINDYLRGFDPHKPG